MNRSEEATNSILRPLTEAWGAHAFPKVRLADVLPIENSGIDDQLFRFALQSHFDFIVTDDDLQPLFAVEFDGPTHDDKLQKSRDINKNQLCERFNLPLLRVNARCLSENFRTMPVLAWFANYWFAQRLIDDARQSGDVPYDADIDPMLMVNMPGSHGKVPLWLTAETRSDFHRFRDQGKCIDPGPSSFVGLDASGNYRAISYMAITEDAGLVSETGMRSQQFPAPCDELVDAIAEHQVHADFISYLASGTGLLPIATIADKVRCYYKTYDLMTSGVCSHSIVLRSAAAMPGIQSGG